MKVEQLEKRTAILPKPTVVVWEPDTLPGKINAVIEKAMNTGDFYFRGTNPKVGN